MSKPSGWPPTDGASGGSSPLVQPIPPQSHYAPVAPIGIVQPTPLNLSNIPGSGVGASIGSPPAFVAQQPVLTERTRAPARTAVPQSVPTGFHSGPGTFFNEYDMYDTNKTFWSRAMKITQVDPNAKRIVSMSLVMFALFFIELIWGTRIENLALFAAAFHSFYDAAALTISVITIIVSKEKSSSAYSYGQERFEIVAAFSNGALLIFVGLYIGFEAIEHLFEPPEHVDIHNVAIIGIIGLIVHIVAVVMFKDHIHMRSESAIESKRGSLEKMLKDVLIDCAPSIGVIMASSVIHLNEWMWSDALVSLLIAVSLLSSALPVCVATGRVLLQSVPFTVKDILDKSLRDALTVEGVLEIKPSKVHFWTYSPGVYVGTLLVRVRADADEQNVLHAIQTIFSPFIQHLSIQIEKKDFVSSPTQHHLHGESSNSGNTTQRSAQFVPGSPAEVVTAPTGRANSPALLPNPPAFYAPPPEQFGVVTGRQGAPASPFV